MYSKIKKGLGFMAFALMAVIGFSFAGGEKASAASACYLGGDFCVATDATNYYASATSVDVHLDHNGAQGRYESKLQLKNSNGTYSTVATASGYTYFSNTDYRYHGYWSFSLVGKPIGQYKVVTDVWQNSTYQVSSALYITHHE